MVYEKDDVQHMTYLDGETTGTQAQVEPVWLRDLNTAQKQAVLNVEGATLVLAGAGTGKTRILTSRMAQIVFEKKANPHQILCVTFTNKAATEMKERVNSLLGIISGTTWLGTFHSLCLRILRRHAEYVHLNSNFIVLDTEDQVRLLKHVLAECNIEEKRFPAKHVLSQIQSLKDKARLPEAVSAKDIKDFNNDEFTHIYSHYQRRLRALNAVDFGDIIMLCVDMLKNAPDLLTYYKKTFKYILVDEYQDTNSAQYQWLLLLSKGREVSNICCVGDDDQSIYGWRGAEVNNILHFEKDFPTAKVIRLEQNYRSTAHILQCANILIANNSRRLGKNLFTSGQTGSKVMLQNRWDSEEEAHSIAVHIRKAQHRGEQLSSIAILVRAGFQTRAFEECFLHLSLPYKIIGATKFYEREEIRDAIAYIRVMHQQCDDLALERIINKPTRGIGKTTWQKIRNIATEKGISLYDSAQSAVQTAGIPVRAKSALNALLSLFALCRQKLKEENHTTVIQTFLEDCGYLNLWRQSKDPKAEGKSENLKELMSVLERFKDIAEFLEHIALVMEKETHERENMVSLMTLHAAKGLEFDTIFLPGWEEGLFPSEKSVEEKGIKGLEEERRLAYVGITRAKKYCHISFVNNRRIHGKWVNCIPSRFVSELPLEHTDVGAMQQSTWHTRDTPCALGQKDGFCTGDRCFHQKFGMGTIYTVDGDYLTINFDKAGQKKIMASFVEKMQGK